MDNERRQAILDNAKYLRNVRPIDPEEIQAYVSGQPHPGVIRETLRNAAFDLALRERDDGTFVPALEGHLPATIERVEGFPERYGRVLENLLVAKFGPGWPDGESGDRIRGRIRSLKDAYLHDRSVTYDRLTALAYALYHLPDYYAVGRYAFEPLLANGWLPAQLRVLDVGAGVGGPALGLVDTLCAAEGVIDYHAVEPSDPVADILEELLAETGPNAHWTVHRDRAETFQPTGTFDLLLFGNVLNELDEPASVLRRYESALDARGSIVALAPADKQTATGLREVERAVEDSYTVAGPTVRLWAGETPQSECWSFTREPDLEVPHFQRRLAESEPDSDGDPGEFVNVDVQYAYSILRLDEEQTIEYTPDPKRVAKMANAESYVTDRIDAVAVKLSPNLSEDADANPLFLVGDGSEQIDHFAVLTRESILNQDLRESEYGDLLRFENVLALWNDDEAAYNLVVDAETVVDRLPA